MVLLRRELQIHEGAHSWAFADNNKLEARGSCVPGEYLCRGISHSHEETNSRD